jgi:hypothetical protein
MVPSDLKGARILDDRSLFRAFAGPGVSGRLAFDALSRPGRRAQVERYSTDINGYFPWLLGKKASVGEVKKHG